MDALQRHAWYKDTVRKADRSRGASATVPEAAKVVQGAAEFVYGKGNSKKGHLPGVQVVCVCVCVCVCGKGNSRLGHIPGVQVGYVDMCTHTSRCMHACCMHARVNAPTCCCMHNTFYSKRTHSIAREHILCMHARVNAPTCCYLQV